MRFRAAVAPQAALSVAVLSIAALTGLVPAAPLAAQPPAAPRAVRVVLGDSVGAAAAPGATLRLPVRVELATPRTPGLASIQLVARWDTAQLRLDSLRTARGAPLTVTANTATAPTGMVRFNAFAPTAVARSAPLADLYFTMRLPAGQGVVRLDLEAAGDEAGADMTAAVATQGATVCASSCRRQP